MSTSGSGLTREPWFQNRSTAGIEPYSGPWNVEAAVHLLRRTSFGPLASEVSSAVSMSLDRVLPTILEDRAPPAPPVDPTTGQTWIDRPFDSTNEGRHDGYLKAWWMGLMTTQGTSIREKMVLFWHNHFAVENDTVQDSRLMYVQNALLRRHALGNIKELARAITVDPAMLVYLNGFRNRGDGRNIPDENYGRELQELFTIGKGPQLGPGNYTNYTEQDVKAAARVLTGWRVNGYRDTRSSSISSYFDSAWHDKTDKEFSTAYRNTRITGGIDGRRETDDLIEMIFRQEETAKFLCRKLYRWFVYYDIDSAVEENVIVPLSNLMRSSGYQVRPVLDALFRSAHFFSETSRGCVVKTPVDFVAGTLRTMEIVTPSLTTQTLLYYSLMSNLRSTAATLQMNPMEPPNVAGWPAYYQTPDFYRLWINTVTLPVRWGYTDSLVNGLSVSGTRFAIDSIALARRTANPGDPYLLAEEMAASLFPVSLTTVQGDYLVRNVLMAGLPDYEWTGIWGSYVSDPNNTQKRNAVATRLNTLLKFMMRMAEFELT